MDTKELGKIVKRFESKYKRGYLEVEDILKLAKIGDKTLIKPLKELALKLNWRPLNADLIVPFSAWVDIVCLYLEEGVAGLYEVLSKKNEFAQLALGVIDELKRQEGVEAMINLFERLELDGDRDYDFMKKLVRTLCFARFIPDLSLASELKSKATLRLKDIILYAQIRDDNTLKAIAVYCFAAFGDMKDIEYLKRLTPIREPYVGAEKIAIKGILKREKTSAAKTD